MLRVICPCFSAWPVSRPASWACGPGLRRGPQQALEVRANERLGAPFLGTDPRAGIGRIELSHWKLAVHGRWHVRCILLTNTLARRWVIQATLPTRVDRFRSRSRSGGSVFFAAYVLRKLKGRGYP